MTKTRTTYYCCDSYSILLNEKKAPSMMEKQLFSNPGGWFETKEEASAHFAKARTLAEEKAKEILQELKWLQNKLGFSIAYQMIGDTHGIYEDYLYLEIKMEGYEFIYKMED